MTPVNRSQKLAGPVIGGVPAGTPFSISEVFHYYAQAVFHI